MEYKLIAVDIDGTLLNSQKKVSPGNQAALNAVLDCGKHAVFSTGRCLAELNEFFGLFPKMRYAICESGACIYDLVEQRPVFRKPLAQELTRRILDYGAERDIMPQALAGEVHYLPRRDVPDRLEHFHMNQYREQYMTTATLLEDVFRECQDIPLDKICLYHGDPAQRPETWAAFEQEDVVLSLAEESSVEFSPKGVDKGNGLERLCAHLGISVEETVAVGDAYNDLPILRKAGLSVAMGNANEEVKAVCDIVAADNDHDGVAETARRYLF